jgi:hypothetical protein
MDRAVTIGHNLSNAPKTLAWEPLDSPHILACPRIAVARVKHLMSGKLKWFEQFATNEKIAECCRNMDAHDIEAWYSGPADRDKGIPDIYKIYCSCGRCHVKFCVGGNHPDAVNYSKTERPELYDLRPFWDVR